MFKYDFNFLKKYQYLISKKNNIIYRKNRNLIGIISEMYIKYIYTIIKGTRYLKKIYIYIIFDFI